MAIKITSGLAEHLLVTGTMKEAFDGGEIRFYSGDAPATAGAAKAGDVLWTVTVGGVANPGNGVTWSGTVDTNEGVAVSLVKTPSEVWSGATTAGTVKYFRIVQSGDGDDENNADLRIQGTVGMNTTYDFYMSNTTLTTNASLTAKVISAFTVGLPLG